MSEFKEALVTLETTIKADNKEQIEKALDKFTSEEWSKFKQDSDESVKKMVNDLIAEGDAVLTKKFNDFSAKLNEKQAKKANEQASYRDNMKSFIKDNFDKIGNVSKGKEVKFDNAEMKAVADMLTTGDHVTGDYIRDYNRTVITLPGQAINVADLIPSVTIDGGTYTYIRETGGEGAFAYQTEGSDKAQVDSDFAHIDVSTDFLAGRTVYSKKMRNNLQYLQSYLPEALRRKYFIAENADFYTKISTGATASTALIANHSNIAEKLTAEKAALEQNNYNGANGAVTNIADWYGLLEIEKSTGAGYGLPIGWSYSNGTLRAFEIPVLKAPWVATNKYLIGDWSMA
ncbi:MAG: hypothetical protein HRU12_15615, partial [Phaeodactylibacter sp.]|nr:hypothetical protein [Phaeodactylibacter sp.]